MCVCAYVRIRYEGLLLCLSTCTSPYALGASRPVTRSKGQQGSLAMAPHTNMRTCAPHTNMRTWVQVQLGAGWSAQGSVMRNGLGNVAGWSATEALQHLIEGSMPFPAHLPASAQVRFSKDTNSVQLRMGSKGGSGVFYVWHAADDAAAHLRLEGSDAPAFIDILCTQGALAGHYKGLLFSSPQVWSSLASLSRFPLALPSLAGICTNWECSTTRCSNVMQLCHAGMSSISCVMQVCLASSPAV